MMKPPFNALALSILMMLAFFLAETSCFRCPERRRHSPRLLAVGDPNQQFGNASDDRSRPMSPNNYEHRRGFLTDLLSKGAIIAGTMSSTATLPSSASAAEADLVSSGTIKVTSIAHTFVTSGKSPSPKPIRENDATRFFTNARVVYLFEGSENGETTRLAQEVTDLTKARKAEMGPGVTPGNVQTLSMKAGDADQSAILARVIETAKQLSDGDVLLVGPIKSRGTLSDGKLLASTAEKLGTFVGGQKGQGVLSVLLNGPKENIKLIESGIRSSELLWYSLPPKG